MKNKAFKILTALVLLNTALYGYLYYSTADPTGLQETNATPTFSREMFEKAYAADSVKRLAGNFSLKDAEKKQSELTASVMFMSGAEELMKEKSVVTTPSVDSSPPDQEKPAEKPIGKDRSTESAPVSIYQKTPRTGGLTGDWVVFNDQDNVLFSWSLRADGSCTVFDFIKPEVAANTTCSYQFNSENNRLVLSLGADEQRMQVTYQYVDDGSEWRTLVNLSGNDPLLMKPYEKPTSINLTGNWTGFDANQPLDVQFFGGDTVRFIDDAGGMVEQLYELSDKSGLTRIQFSYMPEELYYIIPISTDNVLLIDGKARFRMDLYRR